MKKKIRKLSLARETLRHLETSSLPKARAGVGIFPGNTDEDTICICTEYCMTLMSLCPC